MMQSAYKFSKSLMYSPGKNDECKTPLSGVRPILPYIPRRAIVWCPFDTERSAFVRLISKENRVVYSHIKFGHDFLRYEPKSWDVIVSNPPFTGKRDIFERALSFGKPFALIMSNTWLNDSAPVQVFRDRDLQLLMFENRMEFLHKGPVKGRITFSISYYCWNFLPKQIIMGGRV